MEDRSIYQGVYEKDRLKKYNHVSNRPTYSTSDIANAYRMWMAAEAPERMNAWHVYCDMRDNVPLGTNHRLSIIKEVPKQ